MLRSEWAAIRSSRVTEEPHDLLFAVGVEIARRLFGHLLSPHEVYAGGETAIHRGSDGGETWTDMSPSLAAIRINGPKFLALGQSANLGILPLSRFQQYNKARPSIEEEENGISRTHPQAL